MRISLGEGSALERGGQLWGKGVNSVGVSYTEGVSSGGKGSVLRKWVNSMGVGQLWREGVSYGNGVSYAEGLSSGKKGSALGRRSAPGRVIYALLGFAFSV